MRFIVLPAFNEGSIIKELIYEYVHADSSLKILVVNDASTDDTLSVLNSIADENNGLFVISNEINIGHGLSVIRGLELALNMGANAVVTADSDGNYKVDEVLRLFTTLETSNCLVVEGIRVFRDDPWFRRIASFTTRQLVFARSKQKTLDANTPFHAYNSKILPEILNLIPHGGKVIPNLYISCILRERGIPFVQLDITSKNRKGNNSSGVTWKQKYYQIPSIKYIGFCLKAITNWFLRR